MGCDMSESTGGAREGVGFSEKLNFTLNSPVGANNFITTGDAVRDGRSELCILLEQWVHVAMIYGDRDFSVQL
jgi:hypothetical protein